MTEFFSYETLTYPEVNRLERDTPLLLPLGSEYDLERVTRVLGSPPRAGLLPALPFGWQGSGLEAPGSAFFTLLHNLAQSLRDEGFSRVFVLAPQGLDLPLSIPCLVAGGRRMPAPLIPADSERGKVLLIPIGHTEQHSLHLSMNTDTVLIEAVAQGAARQAATDAACLPVFPYGVSTHRAAFGGTLNCGGRAFEDFWIGVVDVLARRGFDLFYLLSGHGGNCSFLTNVVKYSGERHPHIFCATAWLYLSGPSGIQALQERRRSPIGGMGHACELETSLMLHLRPDCVHMERAVDDVDFISTPSYVMDWVESGALIANPPWEDDSQHGAYGAGSLGDAENGRFWLQAAVDEKVGHIAEIREQQRRRVERRDSRNMQ